MANKVILVSGGFDPVHVGHVRMIEAARAYDNRWDNLREATRTLNQENVRRARRDNSTGFLGVRRMKSNFQANIRVGGRSKNLGTYPTPEQAHAAYVEAKRRLHPGNTL